MEKRMWRKEHRIVEYDGVTSLHVPDRFQTAGRGTF